MERDQLRLELLRLVYKPHEHPDKAIVSARILEEYVVGAKAEQKAPVTQNSPGPVDGGKDRSPARGKTA